MARNLFIAVTEPKSGSSLISLGIMEVVSRSVGKAAFFRPIINSGPEEEPKDNEIDLISSHFNLDIPKEKMYAYTADEMNVLLSQGRQEELLEGIRSKYNELKQECDFIVCKGVELEGPTASFEFDINAEVSKNLGSPVVLVANAYGRSVPESHRSIIMHSGSFIEKGCKIVATVVNRLEDKNLDEVMNLLDKRNSERKQLFYTIPNIPLLRHPSVGNIAKMLNARVLYGEDQLHRHVYNYTVGAMQLQNFLKNIKQDTLIITSGDRADILVACLSSISSMSVPNISGILLTGGLMPEESVHKLIEGFQRVIPILSVKEDTYTVTRMINEVRPKIDPADKRTINLALGVFEKHINTEELKDKVIKSRTTIVTPSMFEYDLLQQARTDKQHIVLPEGEDNRILRAAEVLSRRNAVKLTLLGDEKKIRKKADELGIHLNGTKIIEPANSEYLDDYIQTYYEMRKHKGITMDNARDIMVDVSFFGTMMVQKGHADGMVSGAVHTTGDTVRPAFQIIKTCRGSSIVSSVFFMCLKDRVLVYGDCAVNPNPNAEELSEIAIRSAHTAKIFGIEPRVAMLSYSTGESGKGEDVDVVREAAAIAKQKAPELLIEGPIQYDAAVDMKVALTKMPDSEVAGRATVFIFPDLNTGNNTYKAVQRSAKAVAIGPVLQGLKKPVNDLSRGCLIPDIVNTVVITAIQAQAEKRAKAAK